MKKRNTLIKMNILETLNSKLMINDIVYYNSFFRQEFYSFTNKTLVKKKILSQIVVTYCFLELN